MRPITDSMVARLRLWANYVRAVRMVAGLERGDRMKRLHLQVCVELKITNDHKWVTAIRQHLREHLPAPIADNYYIVVKIAPPTQTFIHLGMLLPRTPRQPLTHTHIYVYIHVYTCIKNGYTCVYYEF